MWMLFVHRAATWAWCGRVWHGVGSTTFQMFASGYPPCCLVEEPGWGVWCHCTSKKTLDSHYRKWMRIWNVGFPIYQLCTLISEGTQVTGLMYWQQYKDATLCYVIKSWNLCMLKDVAVTPFSIKNSCSVTAVIIHWNCLFCSVLLLSHWGLIYHTWMLLCKFAVEDWSIAIRQVRRTFVSFLVHLKLYTSLVFTSYSLFGLSWDIVAEMTLLGAEGPSKNVQMS